MLVINDERFTNRAEIIREKGTNRSSFFRGEVDKYGWVDIGSSFLPSDIIAAFLFAQIENLENIQSKRKEIWSSYYKGLKELENKNFIKLPFIPDYASNNAHMFYIQCLNLEDRTDLISHLKKININAVFHYLSLHKSPYYIDKHDQRELPNSDLYSDCLLRLPMYYELTTSEIELICSEIASYYQSKDSSKIK